MKNTTCLISLIFIVLASNAQNEAIDSLKLLLPGEKTDTGKIQKLIYIGDAYGWRDNDTALIYFRDALSRSERIGYIPGEIRTRSSMAKFLFYVKTDYATALELFLYNRKVEEQTADTLFIFSDTRHIGFIYERIEDHEKQFDYIKKLRDLTYSGYIKDNVTLSLHKVIVDSRLGSVYEKLELLDSAKYYRIRIYHYGNTNKVWLRMAV